jgi:large subunit ribosomal protein L25
MATLNAKLRDGAGKGVARKLRRAGEIPAVTYGHGQQSRALTVNAHELELLLATINPDNTIIDLRIEGSKPAMALIREVQHHPSRPYIQHLDLFQVKAGEKIHVDVPIRLLGSPVGVRDMGGVLQEAMHELSVECLPKNIPSAIDIDVENLQLGQSIHVSDVNIDNATILNDADLVICSVTTPSTAELPEPTADEEESDAEPEVIRERKEAE